MTDHERLLADVFGYEDGGSEQAGGITRQRLVAPGAERGNIVDVIRERPLQVLFYLLIALLILYFSTKPFLDLGG